MAVGVDRIARDIAFTLEVKSPKIFENAFLKNGCLVMLGAKGRVKIVTGGNRFDERVRLGQNGNVGHRSKFSAIPLNYQDNVKTAYYGQAVCDGAAIVNLVEVDQNAGSSRIESLAEDAIDELMITFPNNVGDALMASSAGETDPVSIKETLEATAFGSQTSTLGGIVRSNYPGLVDPTQAWQNRYSNTSADISSAAGIATVTKFLWECSEGGSMDLQPDFGITTPGVMAQASGGADVLRRYNTNEQSLYFGFNSLRILNATLVADRNAAAKAGYFLNTNFARVQVLGGPKTKQAGSVKVIGDGKVGVPLQVRQPIESEDHLSYSIKAYMVYNLTFGSLKYHGLMDNLTEA